MHRSVRFPCRILLTLPLVVLLGTAGPAAAAPARSEVGPSAAARSALGTEASSADRDPVAKLPGLRCAPRKTPLRCDIYAKYRGWLAYLNYVPMWQVWAKPGGRYDWRAHW